MQYKAAFYSSQNMDVINDCEKQMGKEEGFDCSELLVQLFMVFSEMGLTQTYEIKQAICLTLTT